MYAEKKIKIQHETAKFVQKPYSTRNGKINLYNKKDSTQNDKTCTTKSIQAETAKFVQIKLDSTQKLSVFLRTIRRRQ